jgi:hypothetical protein
MIGKQEKWLHWQQLAAFSVSAVFAAEKIH